MKDFETVSSVLEKLPIDVTRQEIELMWCREVLRRTLGNRTKTGKLLDVADKTVYRFISMLKARGISVTEYDIAGRDKRGPNKKVMSE